MAHLPTQKLGLLAEKEREGGTTGRSVRVFPDGADKVMTNRNVAAQCGIAVWDSEAIREVLVKAIPNADGSRTASITIEGSVWMHLLVQA